MTQRKTDMTHSNDSGFSSKYLSSLELETFGILVKNGSFSFVGLCVGGTVLTYRGVGRQGWAPLKALKRIIGPTPHTQKFSLAILW